MKKTNLQKYKYFKKIVGFTLAEVLITLAVIGVIAVITAGVIQNQHSKETYVALQKAQSELQNAVTRTMSEYGCVGDMKCTGLFEKGNDIASTIFALNGITEAELNSGVKPTGMVQFFNVMKNCGKNTGCFPNVTYETIGGKKDTAWLAINASASYYAKVVLNDGASVAWIQSASNNCTRDVGNGPMDNTCGTFLIDINGVKEPNTYGRDLFGFWLSTNGIIYPGGNSHLTQWGYPAYCDTSNTTSGDNGIACTAKVLNDGGVNY